MFKTIFHFSNPIQELDSSLPGSVNTPTAKTRHRRSNAITVTTNPYLGGRFSCAMDYKSDAKSVEKVIEVDTSTLKSLHDDSDVNNLQSPTNSARRLVH